jgi:hypothetical protein
LLTAATTVAASTKAPGAHEHKGKLCLREGAGYGVGNWKQAKGGKHERCSPHGPENYDLCVLAAKVNRREAASKTENGKKDHDRNEAM